MLPSPPHWATRRPCGFKARARFRKRRSWSLIQCNVAVEKMRSTGSSTSSSNKSWRSTRTLGSPTNRLLAASTIALDLSTARTDPAGNFSSKSSVTRPVPHPASMAASSPLVSSRPTTPAPQPVCGAESFSYSASIPLATQDHTFLVLSQNVRHNDQHMDSIEVISSGGKSGVGVLDKSVAILAYLSESGPASLAGVVAGTGLPRPTAHRLLSALETHHLVSRQDGRYVLGSEVARVGKPGCRGWPRGAGAARARNFAGPEWGEHAALRAGGRAQGVRGVRGAGDGVEGHRARGGGHAALAGVCGEDSAGLRAGRGRRRAGCGGAQGYKGQGLGPERGREGGRGGERQRAGLRGGRKAQGGGEHQRSDLPSHGEPGRAPFAPRRRSGEGDRGYADLSRTALT